MSQRRPDPQELPDSPSPSPEEWVLRWQGPVYNFVLRMLGNAADAADVTQEVFLRVLRALPQGSPREAQSWIISIARNAVSNHLRDLGRRRRREAQAMAERSPESADDSLEQDEIRQRLLRELRELSEESRSIIVLHYMSGLSHRRIAEVLGIPRARVGKRLGASLDALRGRLGASGCLLAMPGLQSLLEGVPQVPVPAEVTAQLLSAAANSGSVASGAAVATALSKTTIMGGVALMKTTAIVGVVVASIALTLFVGSTVAGRKGRREAALLRGELDAARDGKSELESQLATLRARDAELTKRLGELRAELEGIEAAKKSAAAEARAAREAAGGEAPKEVAGGEDSAGDAEGGMALDWSGVENLVAADPTLVLRLGEMLREGKEPSSLSREDQLAVQSILAEWNRLASEARLSSDYPFFDEKILPRMFESLFGAPLDLDEGQRGALESAARDLLRQMPLPEGATPLEAQSRKLELTRELTRRFGEEVLKGDQLGAWEKLRPLWEHIALGRRQDYGIGINNEYSGDQVRNAWRDLYGLRPEQLTEAEPLSTRYVERARETLVRFEQGGPTGRALEPAARQQLEEAWMRLQLEMEAELLPRLDEEQLAALAGRMPITIRFGEYAWVSINSHADLGF